MPSGWPRGACLSLPVVVTNLRFRWPLALPSNILLDLLHPQHNILVRDRNRVFLQFLFRLILLFITHFPRSFDQVVHAFVLVGIWIIKFLFAVYLHNHLVSLWSKLELS
jgi:hypothetical protein